MYIYKKKKNQLIASEKVSHFEWINNEKILVWCRNLPRTLEKFRKNFFIEEYLIRNLKKIINKIRPNLRQMIVSEYYHLINVNDPKEIIKIGENILTTDGHPQLLNNSKQINSVILRV